jgi:hypothetical protein
MRTATESSWRLEIVTTSSKLCWLVQRFGSSPEYGSVVPNASCETGTTDSTLANSMDGFGRSLCISVAFSNGWSEPDLGSIPLASCKLVLIVPIIPGGRLQRRETVGLI